VATQLLGRSGVASNAALGRRGSASRLACSPGVGATLVTARRFATDARLATGGAVRATSCSGCGLNDRMYVFSASIAVGSISARRSTLATRSVGASSRFVSHRGRVTVTCPSVTSYPGMSFASTQLRTTTGISQTSCVDFRGHQGSVSRIDCTVRAAELLIAADMRGMTARTCCLGRLLSSSSNTCATVASDGTTGDGRHVVKGDFNVLDRRRLCM